MLREVVREVFGAWSPNYLELSLSGTVSQPVKLHVDCFGAALFDGVVEDAFGTFVVSSDHCGRLVVSEFDERLSDGAGILGIHEAGCYFGLCSGGNHRSDHRAKHVDWSIHWWALARREFGRCVLRKCPICRSCCWRGSGCWHWGEWRHS